MDMQSGINFIILLEIVKLRLKAELWMIKENFFKITNPALWPFCGICYSFFHFRISREDRRNCGVYIGGALD